MPIEEYDGLKNKIAKLQEDIHKYTVEGKIKVKWLQPIEVFNGGNSLDYARYTQAVNPEDIENLQYEEFKNAVKEIYDLKDAFQMRMRDHEIDLKQAYANGKEEINWSIKYDIEKKANEEVDRRVRETIERKLEGRHNYNFMQRLVYLFRGKL